jgi:ribosomal protein S4E
MKTLKLISAILLSVSLLSSCKKDKKEDPVPVVQKSQGQIDGEYLISQGTMSMSISDGRTGTLIITEANGYKYGDNFTIRIDDSFGELSNVFYVIDNNKNQIFIVMGNGSIINYGTYTINKQTMKFVISLIDGTIFTMTLNK